MECPDGTLLDAALPRRPRLSPGRAVLWRDPGAVQLGLDPRHALVVENLSPPLARLVHGLDGRRTLPELLAEATDDGCAPGDAARLLTELHSAGVLDDAAAAVGAHAADGQQFRLAADAATWAVRTGRPVAELLRTRLRSAVVVHGSGRLGAAVAVVLAAAGVGRVRVEAEGHVRPEDTGCGYPVEAVGRPRAEAAAEAVLAAAPAMVTAPPARRRPDLVVLTDTAPHDPGLTAELMRHGTPHLAVQVREGVAVVGPLVMPGRSSCLRCAELHRAGLDPAWPKLAAQLAGSAPHAELASAQAAAALAGTQVLAALAGAGTGQGPPPVWSATLELDPLQGSLRRRPWPAHPRCGCGSGTGRTRYCAPAVGKGTIKG